MINSRNLALAISVALFAWAEPVTAATLSGTVTANGHAVDSAVVSIFVARPGARKFVTITNASGAYRFTNVLNGLHILIVEKDGRRIFQGSMNVQVAAMRFDVNL